MTLDAMLTELRERLVVAADEVSDARLLGYLRSAAVWWANRTAWEVKEELYACALIASAATYPLPEDCVQVLGAKWNDQYLEPRSLPAMVRDRVDVTGVDAGDPREFYITGSSIGLFPPPDSGAVTTDPYVHLIYIQSTSESLHQLPVGETYVIVYKAAIEYLSSRPTDEHTARLQLLERQLDATLKDVQSHALNRIREQQGGMRVVNYRRGGSR